MKERKVFIMTDLGPGDGGKGGVVHKVCTTKKAHTVIKVGGCQGSHGVRTSNGQSFNFSHFGCGTFEGVKTHISERMIIDPYGLLQEASYLQNKWRISDIFNHLTVDGNSLCVTPFHTYSSRLRELLRKDNPKGTVGVGVGEALRDSENFLDTAIFVKDLNSPNLKYKLQRVKEKKFEDFKEILSPNCSLDDYFLPQDHKQALQIINLLDDDEFIDRIVDVFNNAYLKINVTDENYFRSLLQKDGVMVIESSHGVLNDRTFGFWPHITHLNILPEYNIQMLNKYGYTGDIVKLGVTRAYSIRHGAGPLVTNDAEMVNKLLPGSHKLENRWQGKVRVGPLDFLMLDYAVNICGGPDFFDGLAITCFDQVVLEEKWDMCKAYELFNSDFLNRDGKIKVYDGLPALQNNYQKELTKFLYASRPVLSSVSLANQNQKILQKTCQDVFKRELNIPVRMISFGPTELDKVLI